MEDKQNLTEQQKILLSKLETLRAEMHRSVDARVAVSYTHLADLIYKHLNREAYAEDVLKQYGAEITPYGMVNREDFGPLHEPIPEQQQELSLIHISKSLVPVSRRKATGKPGDCWPCDCNYSLSAGSSIEDFVPFVKRKHAGFGQIGKSDRKILRGRKVAVDICPPLLL